MTGCVYSIKKLFFVQNFKKPDFFRFGFLIDRNKRNVKPPTEVMKTEIVLTFFLFEKCFFLSFSFLFLTNHFGKYFLLYCITVNEFVYCIFEIIIKFKTY